MLLGLIASLIFCIAIISAAISVETLGLLTSTMISAAIALALFLVLIII